MPQDGGLPTRMSREGAVLIENFWGLFSDLLEGIDRDFMRVERFAPLPPMPPHNSRAVLPWLRKPPTALG